MCSKYLLARWNAGRETCNHAHVQRTSMCGIPGKATVQRTERALSAATR
uniref:Uncharacterized protein n=1 Tax=Arundo donax TaxID=35708 RepID=A0A0A9AZX1_ARUDO